jgi:hypothetical protein
VLQKDLGLEGGRGAAPPAGVLDLGATADGRARVFYVVAAVPEAERPRLASAIAAAALPAHAVIVVPRGRGLGRELTVELDPPEQLGVASAWPAVERVLATLGRPSGNGASAKGPRPKVTLSIPGTWSKMRTDVEIDGEACAVQNGGFVVLFAAVAAALRQPGSAVAHAVGADKAITEALSRMRQDLPAKLPRGFRLVQVARLTTRLNPAVAIGEAAFEALEAHPDPRIAKIARQRRPKP